jgi:hypothetical protein
MKDIKPIAERIEIGIAFLNKVMPDWLNKIDFETLDMRNPRHCLLGQLYGRFGKACNEFVWDCEAAQGGFDLYEEEARDELWSIFDEQWKHRLAELTGLIPTTA